MALAAAQVVDALAALLVPMAATGGRVKTSRIWPWSEAELPAWRVYAGDEAVELATISGDLEQHNLQVYAQCSARATADLDDVLNALAAAGLTLLQAAPPYGLQLQRITRGLQQGDEASLGVITLDLKTLFFTVPSAPETIIS